MRTGRTRSLGSVPHACPARAGVSETRCACFPTGFEVSSYQKYLSVGKTLVTDEIISTWGIPAKSCNDCATYLNGQILKYSCKFWSIIQSFHSTYDLQTFSLTSDYQNWLQLLTLLAKDTPINSTKSKIYLFWRAQLSPNKIITRHPTNVGEVPHNLSLLKGDITYHQKGL